MYNNQKSCFWPLIFIKRPFQAPSQKTKCQTLRNSISVISSWDIPVAFTQSALIGVSIVKSLLSFDLRWSPGVLYLRSTYPLIRQFKLVDLCLWRTRARNYGVPGAQGSLELSWCSLKYLQGAQRCACVYTQHLYVVFEDAIRLPEENPNFEPWGHILIIALPRDWQRFQYFTPSSWEGLAGLTKKLQDLQNPNLEAASPAVRQTGKNKFASKPLSYCNSLQKFMLNVSCCTWLIPWMSLVMQHAVAQPSMSCMALWLAAEIRDLEIYRSQISGGTTWMRFCVGLFKYNGLHNMDMWCSFYWPTHA